MKTSKSKTLSPEKEALQLMDLVNHNLLQALNVIETQMNVLHMRAQVLMSLASIVITVTGFSGRTIAGTSLLSKILIVLGLATVLISAVWVFLRVMSIKWLTTESFDEEILALQKIIERRNKKTVSFVTGGKILCIGLLLYAAAFSIMLLNT